MRIIRDIVEDALAGKDVDSVVVEDILYELSVESIDTLINLNVDKMYIYEILDILVNESEGDIKMLEDDFFRIDIQNSQEERE